MQYYRLKLPGRVQAPRAAGIELHRWSPPSPPGNETSIALKTNQLEREENCANLFNPLQYGGVNLHHGRGGLSHLHLPTSLTASQANDFCNRDFYVTILIDKAQEKNALLIFGPPSLEGGRNI